MTETNNGHRIHNIFLSENFFRCFVHFRDGKNHLTRDSVTLHFVMLCNMLPHTQCSVGMYVEVTKDHGQFCNLEVTKEWDGKSFEIGNNNLWSENFYRHIAHFRYLKNHWIRDNALPHTLLCYVTYYNTPSVQYVTLKWQKTLVSFEMGEKPLNSRQRYPALCHVKCNVLPHTQC